jgi:hypothetical protein
MTDHELELRLRAWYRAEVEDDERAPVTLRVSIAEAVRATGTSGVGLGRLIGLTLNPLAAAVSVIAVVAVVVAALVLPGRSTHSIGTEPSQTPTLSQAPSASPTPVASACSDGPCLGVLQSGDHQTTAFVPTVHYTVPAGWDNTTDTRGEVDLRYVAGGSYTYPDGLTFHDAVSIFRRPVAESSNSRVPLRGIGKKATDLARWLDGHVDLDATGLTAVTIHGAHGFRISIALPEGPRKNPDQCTTDHGEPRCESLFVSDDPAAGYGFGIVGPETAVVYLLDAPSGDTVMVVIDDVDGVDREGLVAAATPIVNSLDFTP